jgi:dipeptide transport system ATP-binding protein
MSSVIEARGLVRSYEIRQGLFRRNMVLTAVGGVSFTLNEGKTLAVVGESGCGKSTLARLVTMIEPPTSGSLVIDGIDAVHPPPKVKPRLRQTVQLVFQNPYSSLNPRQRVEAILEEPLIINSSLSKAERKAKAAEMLARVGLRPEYARRYPHMFSGGQRQRIAIARALMLSPKIVVADEPLSALDVSVQAHVLNVLTDLQRDLGLAYLFISHDLAVVKHIAHDVLVMYLGLAVEHGSKQDIFRNPLHPYTQALLSSTPAVGIEKKQRVMLKGELPSPLNPPGGCVFSSRCPFVTERCRIERPPLRPVAGRLVACHYAEQFAAQAA